MLCWFSENERNILRKDFPDSEKFHFFAFKEVFFFARVKKNTFLFYYFSVLRMSDARKSLKKNRKRNIEVIVSRQGTTRQYTQNLVFPYTCRDN